MEFPERFISKLHTSWPRGRGWKFLTVLLVIFGFIALIIWVLFKLAKMLGTGSFKNKDLYIPKVGRDFYVPRARK